MKGFYLPTMPFRKPASPASEKRFTYYLAKSAGPVGWWVIRSFKERLPKELRETL